MKRRFLCLAAALLLLLTACGAQDTAPTLEVTLPNTEVPVAFSGCDVEEGRIDLWMDPDQTPETAAYYTADGRPQLCFSGVTEEEVEVRFAQPYETGMRLYTDNVIMPKLDYKATRQEDTLTVQLKTVYYYLITVTTEEGMDRFVISTTLD
ncbi:hypothetical protein INF35_03950 [Subdoligranulum sp. DSM 109015]|uniref:Lipoprotein n=1 Tax=Gemmiger gallinarum TaxID=2779354 RepID=A0ABR9R1D4_9FIRM|nr:hypothetical protein [Gemmiger gallinarum]MBE5036936.1 hypothetical protein [Gemmiger gallinarum]